MFYFRLCTSCDNSPHGCNAVLKLDSLASHLLECMFFKYDYKYIQTTEI